jgi:hypothetical protein
MESDRRKIDKNEFGCIHFTTHLNSNTDIDIYIYILVDTDIGQFRFHCHQNQIMIELRSFTKFITT